MGRYICVAARVCLCDSVEPFDPGCCCWSPSSQWRTNENEKSKIILLPGRYALPDPAEHFSHCSQVAKFLHLYWHFRCLLFNAHSYSFETLLNSILHHYSSKATTRLIFIHSFLNIQLRFWFRFSRLPESIQYTPLQHFNEPLTERTQKQTDTTTFISISQWSSSLECFNGGTPFIRRAGQCFSSMFSSSIHSSLHTDWDWLNSTRHKRTDWRRLVGHRCCFFVGFVFYPWLPYAVRFIVLLCFTHNHTLAATKNRSRTNTITHSAQWD